jgi:hypothetical protein
VAHEPLPKQSERCTMVDGERYEANSWRHQPRSRRYGFRVPTLVLLSGAIIFEGYAQLRVIGSPIYLRDSAGAALFAAASLILIALLDGPAGIRPHRTSEGSLVAVRALLVTATLVVFVLPRAIGSRTLGVSDLLVALGILVSAVLDERRASCRRPVIGDLPNLFPSPDHRPPA